MNNGFNDCTDLFDLNLQNEKWCNHVATCIIEMSFLEITVKLRPFMVKPLEIELINTQLVVLLQVQL